MTMLFNPYTGKPRHPSDIASDPKGTLIAEPDAPMIAAAVPVPHANWRQKIHSDENRDSAV